MSLALGPLPVSFPRQPHDPKITCFIPTIQPHFCFMIAKHVPRLLGCRHDERNQRSVRQVTFGYFAPYLAIHSWASLRASAIWVGTFAWQGYSGSYTLLPHRQLPQCCTICTLPHNFVPSLVHFSTGHRYGIARRHGLAWRPCGITSLPRHSSGARALPTFRWPRVSFTWWRSWIGQVARVRLGVCRIRWMYSFVSRRWKRPWIVTAARKSPTRTKAVNSPHGPGPTV